MASDPERPIEKLLRSCAEKRREEAGAPLELHPATRRLLQGEVARQFPKPASQAGATQSFLGRFWPRLAWGLAGAAALAAVILVLVPARTEKPELLARNEPAAKSAPAENRKISEEADRAAATPAVQPAPSPANLPVPTEQAPTATLAQSSVTKREPLQQPAQQLAGGPQNAVRHDSLQALNAPTAPPPPPMPEASAAAVSAKAFANNELAKTSGAAAQTPATLANSDLAAPRYGLAASTQLGVALAAKDVPADQRLHFVQTEQKAKAALTDTVSPATPVLASFQLEQSASGLQVIDSDGSVYSGYLQPAESATGSTSAPTRAQAGARMLKQAQTQGAPTATAPADATPQAWSNYFFRVVGTNQTLNQRVVFTGNLVYPANSLTSSLGAANSITGGVGGALFGDGANNALPLLNSRISGKALLDDRKEIEINALPAKP